MPALAAAIWSWTAIIALASCVRFAREPVVWIAAIALAVLIASGHVALLLAALLSLFFLSLWLERAERDAFFGTLLTLCGLQMVAASLAYAFSFEQQLTPGFGTRASGVLGSPNTLYPLAVLAFCGFGAAWSLASSPQVRAGMGAGAALAFAVTILTFSRSGWVGMAAAIGLLTFLVSTQGLRASSQSPREQPLGNAPSALLPLAIGLILLLILGAAVVRTHGLIATPSNDLSAATRWSYWQEATRLCKGNLWLGLGPSGFARYSNLEPAPSDPKNLFLQIAVQTGLVGLLLAMALGIGIARAAWRVEKNANVSWSDHAIARAYLLSLAAMLAAGLFDTPVFALPDRIPSTLITLLLAGMTCRIGHSLAFYELAEPCEATAPGVSPVSAPMRQTSANARRVVIALWCGVLLLMGGIGAWGYKRAFGDSWSGRCILVIDGDTVLVQRGERVATVRLWGIDAPENAQPYGSLARRFAAERAQGQTVKVEVKGYDRYGRTLGYVWLPSGRVLNEELLKNGLAWWYQYFNPHQSDLAALEAAARQHKTGLWLASSPVAPWDFRRSSREARTNSVFAGQQSAAISSGKKPSPGTSDEP